MKKLLLGLGVLAVLAAAGLAVLAMRLDSLARSAILTLAPQVTGTAVRLRSVKLSPLSGRGSLEGLVIGNPEGFKSESAFELGEVRLAVRPRSLLSGPVVVEEVLIRGPKVTYEVGAKGSNLDAILRNAQKASGSSSPGREAPASGKSPARKIRILDFAFLDGKARVESPLLGGQGAEVKLPDLRLKDLGGPDGAPPDQLASAVVSSLTRSVVKAVSTDPQVLSRRLGSAKKAADKALGELKGLFRKR